MASARFFKRPRSPSGQQTDHVKALKVLPLHYHLLNGQYLRITQVSWYQNVFLFLQQKTTEVVVVTIITLTTCANHFHQAAIKSSPPAHQYSVITGHMTFLSPQPAVMTLIRKFNIITLYNIHR